MEAGKKGTGHVAAPATITVRRDVIMVWQQAAESRMQGQMRGQMQSLMIDRMKAG